MYLYIRERREKIRSRGERRGRLKKLKKKTNIQKTSNLDRKGEQKKGLYVSSFLQFFKIIKQDKPPSLEKKMFKIFEIILLWINLGLFNKFLAKFPRRQKRRKKREK